MATLTLFGVSSIQTSTAIFLSVNGRDQHLSSSQEGPKEVILSP